MEHRLECGILVELILPRGLEIQGIEKEHHHIGADVVDDFRNLSGSLVRAPFVDFVDGSRHGKIPFGNFSGVFVLQKACISRQDRKPASDPRWR